MHLSSEYSKHAVRTRLMGQDCPACGAELERIVQAIPGETRLVTRIRCPACAWWARPHPSKVLHH
jgi:C4-type Zn-finger protein